MDLQHPTRKMSKSEESPQGTILVLEDLDAVAKKIKRAVTDAETEVRYDPEAKPGVSNLLSILGACTGEDPAAAAERYTRYGDLKTATRRGRGRDAPPDPGALRRAGRRPGRHRGHPGQGRREGPLRGRRRCSTGPGPTSASSPPADAAGPIVSRCEGSAQHRSFGLAVALLAERAQLA